MEMMPIRPIKRKVPESRNRFRWWWWNPQMLSAPKAAAEINNTRVIDDCV